ncbi:MAG: DNA-binding NtrC family response regulator [Myxococcota bacterium]|jgi:DNA-binding NtrC family response regulator
MSSLGGALPTIAATDLPVLVVGEKGSGHDEVARTLHRLSRRRGPMVSRDAATLDAVTLTAGAAEVLAAAEGGTLLITAVDRLSPVAQAALLEQMSHPGLDSARVVATTSVDLRVEAAERRFLSDLFYSLSGLTVRIAALRDRPLDIERLLGDAMTAAARELGSPPHKLMTDGLDALKAYPWPGNLEELESVAASLASLPRPPSAEDVRGVLDGQDAGSDSTHSTRRLAAIVEDTIAAAVAQNGGDVKRAARALGVSCATVYRRTRSTRTEGDHIVGERA